MLKHRLPEQLDEWRKDAKESRLSPVVQLEASLQRDYDAVRAGLSFRREKWTGKRADQPFEANQAAGLRPCQTGLAQKRVFYKPTRQAAWAEKALCHQKLG